MKKIISLILVLSMLIVVMPSTYAAGFQILTQATGHMSMLTLLLMTVQLMDIPMVHSAPPVLLQEQNLLK